MDLRVCRVGSSAGRRTATPAMTPRIMEYFAVGVLRLEVRIVTESFKFLGPKVGELKSFRNPLRVTIMAECASVGLEDGPTHFSRTSAYESKISLPTFSHEASDKCCIRMLHHSAKTKALDVAIPCFEDSCRKHLANCSSVEKLSSFVTIDTRHLWAANLDSRSW